MGWPQLRRSGSFSEGPSRSRGCKGFSIYILHSICIVCFTFYAASSGELFISLDADKDGKISAQDLTLAKV